MDGAGLKSRSFVLSFLSNDFGNQGKQLGRFGVNEKICTLNRPLTGFFQRDYGGRVVSAKSSDQGFLVFMGN